jgi:hypothetical protein
MTITIVPLDMDAEITPLYCHYGGQSAPQPAFIYLDTVDHELWAAYSPEIGNAVPMSVWKGDTLRWKIPVIQAATANALMATIAPLAEQLLALKGTGWNGPGPRAVRWHTSAAQVDHAIEQICAATEPDFYAVSADDWMDAARASVRAAIAAGRTTDEIAATYQGPGTEHDPYVEHLERWIDAEREEMDR